LVAHLFLRFARPQEFGNVTGGESDLYGEVLEKYYRRVDALVGRALEAAGDSTWVVVTSSHGMDPIPLRRRLLALGVGEESRSGTHEDGPDGLLFARGPGVRPGPLPGKGTIADLTPTVLYALRLPVARDLDGAILTELFAPGYTLSHPVSVIESYEEAAGGDEGRASAAERTSPVGSAAPKRRLTDEFGSTILFGPRQ